jgi:hypothetical protein
VYSPESDHALAACCDGTPGGLILAACSVIEFVDWYNLNILVIQRGDTILQGRQYFLRWKYTHDGAVVLFERFRFTPALQPVCYPGSNTNLLYSSMLEDQVLFDSSSIFYVAARFFAEFFLWMADFSTV